MKKKAWLFLNSGYFSKNGQILSKFYNEMMEYYPECLGWNSVEEVFYAGVRNSVNLNSLVPLCIYVCRYFGTIVDIRKHHYFGTTKPFPQKMVNQRFISRFNGFREKFDVAVEEIHQVRKNWNLVWYFRAFLIILK